MLRIQSPRLQLPRSEHSPHTAVHRCPLSCYAVRLKAAKPETPNRAFFPSHSPACLMPPRSGRASPLWKAIDGPPANGAQSILNFHALSEDIQNLHMCRVVAGEPSTLLCPSSLCECACECVCVCVARTCDGSPACPTSSRCDGTAPTSALRAREHCSRIASPSAQQRASVCGPPITHLACPLPPSGVHWLAHHGADESCWRWRVLAEWSLECQTCKSLCPSHTNPEQSASQIRGIGVMIFRQRLFCARTMLPLSSSFGAQCGALQHPTLPSKRLRPSPRPGLHDLSDCSFHGLRTLGLSLLCSA